MSDSDWPQAGPGLGEYDPLKDGRSSKVQEPGSAKGPGSRAPRTKTPLDRLYVAWRDSIEEGTFGKIARKTIDRPTFAKNVKAMRTEDLQGFDDPDKIIAESFRMFASDVRNGRVKAAGKPMWFVYFGRRHRYLDRARAKLNETNAPEITEDETWI